MNDTCVVSFIYPGIKKKIKLFFKSLTEQTDKNFDLIIFLNNLNTINLDYINLNTKTIKLNSSIILSRFQMLNKLKKLNYKFIIFQDADDTMKKNRISKCKNLLKKNSIIVNDLDIINKKKNIKKYFSKRIKNNSLITSSDIRKYNFMGMSNTSIRKKCLNNIKIPIQRKIRVFDWYFWTILLSKYRAKFINSTTTQYYVRNDSSTCLPTKFSKKIKKNIIKTKKLHELAINKLIKKKKIKNIKMLKNHNINDNKSINNFWWEMN